MGAGAHRDAGAIDDRRYVMGVGAFERERQDRPLAGGGPENAQRVDLAEPLMRIGADAFLMGADAGAALDYVEGIGRARIRAHEESVSAYAHERLGKINSLRIFGTAPGKGPILSFALADAHAHDVATVIDRSGVAVRAGTHCAMPLLQRFGVASTCRASFALYNTHAEVDALADALARAQKLFA